MTRSANVLQWAIWHEGARPITNFPPNPNLSLAVCFCFSLSLPVALSGSCGFMMRGKSSAIGKRPKRGAVRATGRKKAPLPLKIFVSDPTATALIDGKLTPVNQGGWAKKCGGDYFVFWYVDADGTWTAGSGAPAPHMTMLFTKDLGTKYKAHEPAPAWAQGVPDHWD